MQDTQGITQLLLRWSGGDKAAMDELMPLVYDELRRLAQHYVRGEGRPTSLQPTALVHEAYLRLVDQSAVDFRGRGQFFGLAATIMRHVMVDLARRRLAAKRCGASERVSMSFIDDAAPGAGVDLLGLDGALSRLAETRPRHARIVELRFFGGLSIEETAASLGISHATVEREWAFARAWLHRELGR